VKPQNTVPAQTIMSFASTTQALAMAELEGESEQERASRLLLERDEEEAEARVEKRALQVDEPTSEPTETPTETPTDQPTDQPTMRPTATAVNTLQSVMELFLQLGGRLRIPLPTHDSTCLSRGFLTATNAFMGRGAMPTLHAVSVTCPGSAASYSAAWRQNPSYTLAVPVPDGGYAITNSFPVASPMTYARSSGGSAGATPTAYIYELRMQVTDDGSSGLFNQATSEYTQASGAGAMQIRFFVRNLVNRLYGSLSDSACNRNQACAINKAAQAAYGAVVFTRKSSSSFEMGFSVSVSGALSNPQAPCAVFSRVTSASLAAAIPKAAAGVTSKFVSQLVAAASSSSTATTANQRQLAIKKCKITTVVVQPTISKVLQH